MICNSISWHQMEIILIHITILIIRIVDAFMAVVDEDNKVTIHLYLPSKTRYLKFWFKVNKIALGLSDSDGVKVASGLLNIMQKMHDWVWIWRSLGSFARDWSRDWRWSFHGRRVSWWGKWQVFFLIFVLSYIIFRGDGWLPKFSAKYPSWVDNLDPLSIGNIFKFGLPRVIVTDNGKPFDNNQLMDFCSQLGI